MDSPAASKLVRLLGIVLIGFTLFILYRLFHDPLKQEIRYMVSDPLQSTKLSPPNTNFAIVIDQIRASSAIIQNVDPLDSRAYQLALRDGVAHALGTSLPGQGRNIFLFAHSSADLLTAQRYNSVFYLMHHLESGDIIKVWYQGKEFSYAVTEKKIVSPNDTKYLTANDKTETLTLMTCWPPGTTLKRLIIVAKPTAL